VQGLHRLDPGDLVEEPRATGVHQDCVPLHLQELEDPNLVLVCERTARLIGQESLEGRRGAVVHHGDVGVAHGPRVLAERGHLRFIDPGQPVPEVVHGLAQGPPPCLLAGHALAGRTPAVVPPAFDAVRASPRGVLADLDLPGGREPLQVLAVYRDLGQVPGLDHVQAVGHGHVRVPVVVAEGLPVRGHVGQACCAPVVLDDAQ